MLSFPTVKKSTFLLPGPSGDLEMASTYPTEHAPLGIVIICHPDPRQQGTMNNKVVVTVARAADKVGWASLRFNFRGIGNSQGVYGDTLGESDDLRAVIAWVKQVLPSIPLVLAGFSFGSYISAKVATEQAVQQLISIAPPVNHYDFTRLPINAKWLIVQGDQDEVVPYEEVVTWHHQLNIPAKLMTMEGTSHFFHGRLLELQQIIEESLLENI